MALLASSNQEGEGQIPALEQTGLIGPASCVGNDCHAEPVDSQVARSSRGQDCHLTVLEICPSQGEGTSAGEPHPQTGVEIGKVNTVF